MYIDHYEIKNVGNGQRQNNISWARIHKIQTKTGLGETRISWWLVKGETWQPPGKKKLRSDEDLAEGMLSLGGVWELNEKPEQ